METKNNNFKPYRIAGLAFSGCMFVGMGVGSIFGHMTNGMFIGMGVGFVMMAILHLAQQEKQS